MFFLLELIGVNGRPYKPPARFAGDVQGLFDVVRWTATGRFISISFQISNKLRVNAPQTSLTGGPNLERDIVVEAPRASWVAAEPLAAN
jgi:hypothetical protein